MNVKSNSKFKVMVSSVFAVCLFAGCKMIDSETVLPFSIVYGSKTAQDKHKSIYITDEEGKRRIRIVGATLSDGYPAVSPSGKQVAFYGKHDNYKTWSIHTVDLDGKNVRRLTDKKLVWDSSPTWSPDNKTIAYAREYRGDDGQFHEEIWLMNADGSNKQQIKALKGSSPEFMPDGRLLYQTKTRPSQINIATIDGTEITQLTNDDSNNYHPKISPDGKHIAYLANRDGSQEVYVMGIDGSNQTRITKNSISEWDPAWSLDGSKVLFSAQNVHGFYDIYKANKYGSEIEKVVENASQAAGLFGVNSPALESLEDKVN